MTELLSRTEEMILLGVIRLGNNAYGIAIREYLENVLGKSLSVGAIYVPLERLDKAGYLSSYAGEPTPERGGRSKRFYQITPRGLAALQETEKLHDTLWSGIGDLPRYQAGKA
ncbi:MAG TPA: PadR family transcriptional regulator [Anaerolineales bacterium]